MYVVLIKEEGLNDDIDTNKVLIITT